MSIAPPLWHSITYSTTPSSGGRRPASRVRRRRRGRPSRRAAIDSVRTADSPPPELLPERGDIRPRAHPAPLPKRGRTMVVRLHELLDQIREGLAVANRALDPGELLRRGDVEEDPRIVDRDFEDVVGVIAEDGAAPLISRNRLDFPRAGVVQKHGIPADSGVRGDQDPRVRLLAPRDQYVQGPGSSRRT